MLDIQRSYEPADDPNVVEVTELWPEALYGAYFALMEDLGVSLISSYIFGVDSGKSTASEAEILKRAMDQTP